MSPATDLVTPQVCRGLVRGMEPAREGRRGTRADATQPQLTFAPQPPQWISSWLRLRVVPERHPHRQSSAPSVLLPGAGVRRSILFFILVRLGSPASSYMVRSSARRGLEAELRITCTAGTQQHCRGPADRPGAPVGRVRVKLRVGVRVRARFRARVRVGARARVRASL